MEGALLGGDVGLAAAPVAAPLPGLESSSVDGQQSSVGLGLDRLEHTKAQLSALVHKNMLLLRRRAISTLFYVFVPSLVVAGMYCIDQSTTTDPGSFTDGSLAPLVVRECRQYDLLDNPTGPPCKVAVFAPETPDTVAIMQSFATANGLDYGTDVVPCLQPRL